MYRPELACADRPLPHWNAPQPPNQEEEVKAHKHEWLHKYQYIDHTQVLHIGLHSCCICMNLVRLLVISLITIHTLEYEVYPLTKDIFLPSTSLDPETP